MFLTKLFKFILSISIFVCFNFSILVENAVYSPSPAPEQVHLSLGKSNSEMIVTWTTYANVSSSLVQFGLDNKKLDQNATGSVTEFTDNGHRVHFIHRVTLEGLKPKTNYSYQCGSQGHMSKVFKFTTFPEKENWSPKMLLYGDMGVHPGAIIPYINSEAINGTADLVFHNGDLAYDLGDNNSTVGDKFMRLIEDFATKMPFQTSLGNHECTGLNGTANLENYLHRFNMVDQTVNSIDKFQNNPHWNNHYYAFYLGPALVISINMEVYVDTYNYLFKNTTLQHDQETWLIDRLREANKPEARKKHPWIIVFGHQPLYCSSSRQDGSCTTDAEQTRDGLEDIFYRWGVDIVIGAHIHNYEREYPMYKGKRAVQSYEDPYRNPKGPVYIVSGAGGCPEKIDVQFFPRPDWNAFADSQFGYGILEIVNRTTVVYQQKAIIYDCTCDYPLQVIDQVEIVQEHHGPFAKFE